MTRDAVDLYQQVLLDHYRHPRNVRPRDSGLSADGDNPLCGDRITVYVQVTGDIVGEVTFTGTGCAICTASASLMTEAAPGLTLDQVDALCGRVHDLVTASPGSPVDDATALSALAGVRRVPVRAKCALLPWRALHAAVHGSGHQVSTE